MKDKNVIKIIAIAEDGNGEEPEFELDADQFRAFSLTFVRFITGNRECELVALKQLSAVAIAKQYPRGWRRLFCNSFLSQFSR